MEKAKKKVEPFPFPPLRYMTLGVIYNLSWYWQVLHLNLMYFFLSLPWYTYVTMFCYKEI